MWCRVDQSLVEGEGSVVWKCAPPSASPSVMTTDCGVHVHVAHLSLSVWTSRFGFYYD